MSRWPVTARPGINNNFAGSIVTPAQYNIELTLVYTAEEWEIRLTILNLTDDDNWIASNVRRFGYAV